MMAIWVFIQSITLLIASRTDISFPLSLTLRNGLALRYWSACLTFVDLLLCVKATDVEWTRPSTRMFDEVSRPCAPGNAPLWGAPARSRPRCGQDRCRT